MVCWRWCRAREQPCGTGGIVVLLAASLAVNASEQPIDIEVFSRPGCPHCAERYGLGKHGGRWLKLLSGVVMMMLGVMLLAGRSLRG